MIVASFRQGSQTRSVTSWVIIGCGYVGTALARRLVAEGVAVTVTRRDAAAARALAVELSSTGAVMGGALDLAGPPRAADQAMLAMFARDRPTVVCCAPPGADPAAEIARLHELARSAHRFIYVSSTGVYAPGGGAWVDESWPLEPMTAAGQARLAAERSLFAAAPDAVALRAAGIWGPGRGLLDRLRAGTYRIVGDGRTHVSRIHVDDLVAAIVRAAATVTTGAVNIADDDPAPIGEVADALAARLGVAAPPRVPIDAVDPEVAGMLAADRRIANGRMKQELGVVLRYPSWRSAL